MAWTEAGGDVLYVEASLMPGGRSVRLTGQLGEVMRESALTARTYVWSHAEELGIDPKLFRRSGLHIHVPAGAGPQGGPAARGTVVTAPGPPWPHRPVRRRVAAAGAGRLPGAG